MRRSERVLVWFAVVVLSPVAVFAQQEAQRASITGVVKDTSGAVLPGVTVEASSPVLIEKTRSTVTDSSGLYRIIDLRAGTYTVTFSLTGFSTVKREDIELSGAFTATINAELKVGSVEETITVNGETPVVDVQSVKRQLSLNGEVVDQIPTSRGYGGIVVLMPSITNGGADVQTAPANPVFGGAGGRNNEGRLTVDGGNVGASLNGGGTSGYLVDVQNTAEVVTTNTGGLGESEVGGPTINIVPKTGGNSFHGSGYAADVTSGMTNTNYTPALQAAGLGSPLKLLKLWDADAGLGGPILKDRFWFFTNYRNEGSWVTVPGMFANANLAGFTTPGIPNSSVPFTYQANRALPDYTAGSWQTASARGTIQANAKNKFNVFWDEQHPCNGGSQLPNGPGCRQPSSSYVFDGTTTTSPEAGSVWEVHQRVQQATWSATMSNNVLLEAGLSNYLSRWGSFQEPGDVTQNLVRVTEGCAINGCANNGGIAGLTYRSEAPSSDWIGAHVWRASASYVTGTHSMKFGYQGAWHVDDEKNFTNLNYYSMTVQNGLASCSNGTATSCPGVSLTETLNPFQISNRVRYDAVYAQDQWVRGRFTLQGALRFDHAWSYFPTESIGGVRFYPGNLTFSATDPTLTTPSAALCGTAPASGIPVGAGTCINNVTGYKDFSPRGGIAWDMTGDSKTSVKVSFGKYLEAAASLNGNYTAGNPVLRTPTTVTRSFNDVNQNYTPNCNLQNPLANGNCGQISNLNFGSPVFTNSFDSNLMGGWGVRPTDWGLVASIQRELIGRTSVEVNYTRRWLNNFTATDNILQPASDYTPFTVVAPLSARLPGGGGYTIGTTAQPLYNVTQNVASTINNYTTLASNFGNQYQHYNGFLMDLQSRLRNGLTLSVGFNIGDTVSDNCAIRAADPSLGSALTSAAVQTAAPAVTPSNPWCHVDSGWVYRIVGLGTYIIPKVDVLFGLTLRSDQGGQLAANYTIPFAVAQVGGLTHAYANGISPTVNLIQPGTLYGDRINELDFKLAKVFRFGHTRLNAGGEVYNSLNSNSVLTYNQTFNPAIQSGPGAWLQPTQIMTPRYFKVTAQFDF
jgi:Carboxypeptidase regulatory-like domain